MEKINPCLLFEKWILYTRDDHAKAYLKLAQEVHKVYPDLLIEMHDVRVDNINCVEFWWYASTVRHPGIGWNDYRPRFIPQKKQQWEAHKKAMKEYLRLKKFYTQGIFYGLDEEVHIHTLPEN